MTRQNVTRFIYWVLWAMVGVLAIATIDIYAHGQEKKPATSGDPKVTVGGPEKPKTPELNSDDKVLLLQAYTAYLEKNAAVREAQDAETAARTALQLEVERCYKAHSVDPNDWNLDAKKLAFVPVPKTEPIREPKK